MKPATSSVGARDAPDTADAYPRRSRLQALIFDDDGTLADTEETHRNAFNEAFHVHGLGWNWPTLLYSELLGVPGGKERIASYIRRLNQSSAETDRLLAMVPEIHATKTRIYQHLVARGEIRPRVGVGRLMTEAYAVGLRLAIASTTSPENVTELLESGFGPGALRRFSAIATGDAVKSKKPAPDVYQLVLSALGIQPHEAIAFEDSAIGVSAARAAGLFTVAVPSTWTRYEDFAAANLTLQSLGDPGEPLSEPDAWRIGAPFLGVEQLYTLHSSNRDNEENGWAS